MNERLDRRSGDRTEEPRRDADPLACTPYSAEIPLGQGGMGLVLQARHRHNGKRFVVKILLPQLAAQADLADRMRLEARSLAALDGHPNIVTITDSGETQGGRPYIVMERLAGRTLSAEHAARGTLPIKEALDYVCQALAGLAAAHDAGIIHRDIKPSNLFLCDAPEGERRPLKILDFGIAKLLASPASRPSVEPRALATEQHAVIGTPPFLAPEQAIGGAVDARTDIYAMGAVLYWLLTGRAPFQHHTTQAAILRAHLDEAPRCPSELAGPRVPEALDRAVLRALAKRPADRFLDAPSFAAELSRIARDMPANDPPVPTAAPSPPPDLEHLHAPEREGLSLWTLALLALMSMAATVAVGLALMETSR